MATLVKTIGTASRDYSTIQAWEDDLDDGTNAANDATAYSSTDIAQGDCYNDSAFDETVVFNGGGTVGLNQALLTVPSAERHDGTEGTGVRNVRTATNTTIFDVAVLFDIEWIEIDANGNNAVYCVYWNYNSTTRRFLANCIIHGVTQTTSSIIYGIRNNLASPIFRNLVVYDINQTTNAQCYGIRASVGAARDEDVINCTVHDVNSTQGASVIGIEYADHADNAVQNCIVTDSVGTGSDFDYFPSTNVNATVSHNLSSDTTSTGTGSLASKTAANQFVSTTGGSEDLHLKSGADAIDAGTDLGTTPAGVEIDIDGRDRDAEGDTWDIGAHEFVAPPWFYLRKRTDYSLIGR